MRITLALLAALVVTACVSPGTSGPAIEAGLVESERDYQQQLAVQLRFDEEARIDAISQPLLSANEAFCERKGVWLGFGAHTELDFNRQVRRVARERFGYGRALQVSWVDPQGPAGLAGLSVGDRITEIDGRTIRPRANAWVAERLKIESTDLETDVRLGIERKGAPLTLVIRAPRVCGYPVFVNNSSDINAFADGQAIYINRGLINFSRSDEELALVVAHELAHNAMGHISAQRANAATGAVGGLLLDIAFAVSGVDTGGAFSDAGADIGAMRFSQEFENEADYVAMYYLTRAGGSTERVEEFWRRTAAENPRSVVIGGSHPTTPERFVRLQAAREEILAKIEAGEPLAPNMKDGRASPLQE